MKYISYILNLLLAATVLALAIVMSSRPGAQESGAPAGTAAVIDNIMTRTSVRKYVTDREVPDSTVTLLLQAAMAAPTAANRQPWRFYAVSDREMLDSIAARNPYMKGAATAPLAVVVCGSANDFLPGEAAEYWVQDCSAATENLLLAAHAEGLGAVWCGVYPSQERVSEFRQLLSLPDSIVPLSCVTIGYPAETPAPKQKWAPSKVFYL